MNTWRNLQEGGTRQLDAGEFGVFWLVCVMFFVISFLLRRNMDKFASNSQKVYNTWLKRSPNQYYIAATSGTGGKNNDESYVPGLCGLPERLVSLRYYMSSSVFGEIQKIEAVAEKRKKLAIRMDGGEVGIEKEYEKEVKGPLPYVVPLKSNRRDYRRGV